MWMCIVKVVQKNSCWNKNAQAQLQVTRFILLKLSALQWSQLSSLVQGRLCRMGPFFSCFAFFKTELPLELSVILKRRNPNEALYKLEA